MKRAFSWTDIDWSGTMLPNACIGSFRDRMVLTAIVPLIAIAVGVLARLGAGRVWQQTVLDSLLSCTEPCLFMVFILAPGVSRTIFKAWDCTLNPFVLPRLRPSTFLLFSLSCCSRHCTRPPYASGYAVEWSATESYYFLRAQPAIRCYSGDDYPRIMVVALVLVIIWPAGSVLLFFTFVARGRERLLNNTSDQYIRATRFLHKDFKPSCCAPST